MPPEKPHQEPLYDRITRVSKLAIKMGALLGMGLMSKVIRDRTPQQQSNRWSMLHELPSDDPLYVDGEEA